LRNLNLTMIGPLILGLLCLACTSLKAEDRPNIVLMLVDDAGLMDFGGFGGEAHTPNSDQASQGSTGLVAPGVKKAAPMTEEDIADVIKAVADAGAVAKVVGFDGVELHGPMVTPLIQFFLARD